uniref:Saposin B-type domain-containing protein n=1 Tax=Steinernema glaseri TaxID=37863 RepID=A0A1I7ZBS6_9BILA
MKVLICCIAIVAVASALHLPRAIKLDGPKCGLMANKPVFGKRTSAAGANVICEMCLDLVEIAEMYEDCDEEYVEDKLDAKCDSYLHSGVIDDLCRGLVDGLYKFVKGETDKNPAKVCTKLLKSDCHYA